MTNPTKRKLKRLKKLANKLADIKINGNKEPITKAEFKLWNKYAKQKQTKK